MEIPVCVNGKFRKSLEFEDSSTIEQFKELILNDDIIKTYINGRGIRKFMFIPNKAVNIVLES